MYWPLIEWSEWHNEMQFWIFCTWHRSGRPCRRLFDPAIATQLKQAAHFMGQWNTRPTSAFIILSCTDMQIICFMVTPRMNDLRASDVKVWGLCPLSQMWRKPKSKLQIPTPDIWWCPWDKGGAVIYVIGGTHPPIWLAIDINHHQISNGHAFPSAIKCAINLFQNLLLVCVCVSERSSWFWEADERQFVQTRAPREAEGRRWWPPLLNGPGNLKWALSSWKQRSCHTTWEWCENQRRKKPRKVYFSGDSGFILVLWLFGIFE